MKNQGLKLVYIESAELKKKRAMNASNIRVVLHELYLLLEDYAPAWYTEEHHRRALNALLDREV